MGRAVWTFLSFFFFPFLFILVILFLPSLFSYFSSGIGLVHICFFYYFGFMRVCYDVRLRTFGAILELQMGTTPTMRTRSPSNPPPCAHWGNIKCTCCALEFSLNPFHYTFTLVGNLPPRLLITQTAGTLNCCPHYPRSRDTSGSLSARGLFVVNYTSDK